MILDFYWWMKWFRNHFELRPSHFPLTLPRALKKYFYLFISNMNSRGWISLVRHKYSAVPWCNQADAQRGARARIGTSTLARTRTWTTNNSTESSASLHGVTQSHKHVLVTFSQVGSAGIHSTNVTFRGSVRNYRYSKLTAWAHLGKYHLELTSLWVCRTPSTTFRSMTSVPITAGLWGLGYFLHAAVATVSQGWLRKIVLRHFATP